MGMEQEWNGNGTGMEREYSEQEHQTEVQMTSKQIENLFQQNLHINYLCLARFAKPSVCFSLQC